MDWIEALNISLRANAPKCGEVSVSNWNVPSLWVLWWERHQICTTSTFKYIDQSECKVNLSKIAKYICSKFNNLKVLWWGLQQIYTTSMGRVYSCMLSACLCSKHCMNICMLSACVCSTHCVGRCMLSACVCTTHYVDRCIVVCFQSTCIRIHIVWADLWAVWWACSIDRAQSLRKPDIPPLFIFL